ncbi:MAG: hypothetical protein HY721_25185, partial [Planctomycetes bacterium]|nr:hypothetical protein [Planctomycetota bacterium]
MSPRCLPALTALLAIAGSAFSPRGAAAEERDVRALRLVPFPKRVRFEEGSFALDRELVLEAEPDAAAVAGPLIAEELERAGLKRPAVRA